MKPENSRNVDLDAAIDRAVRSMMSAEPRAGLRQRVMSRITETPRRAFSVLRLAVAGGSIAVIALAVAIHMANRPDVANVQLTAPSPPVVAGPSREEPAPTVAPPIAPAAPAVRQTRRSPQPSQVIPRGLVVAQNVIAGESEDVVSAAPERDPDPDPTLSPMLGLDQPAPTIAPLTIAPLRIVELSVAPLQGPLR